MGVPACRRIGVGQGRESVVLVPVLVPEKRLLAQRFELVCSPEGSRFVGLPALSVASHRKAFGVAGGSRERSLMRLFSQLFKAPFPKGRAVMEFAGFFPGAACCHLIDLAILQSGSPPARRSNSDAGTKNRFSRAACPTKPTFYVANRSRSASQARRAPQPGRWRSRKDDDEDENDRFAALTTPIRPSILLITNQISSITAMAGFNTRIRHDELVTL